MPPINKDHAREIAKKVNAQIDTSPKAHDLARVYHNGVLIAAFGIKRGSNRNLGHGHIAKDLHLSPRQTILFAQCSLTVDQWLEILREGNWIDDNGETETPPENEPDKPA